ncbi:arylsulfatase [Moorena sp. SIO4G3]|uniref:arylsulfatase n=1 Tax=Moorena sp. SIO4G3 TaxID=2607821 RepID=UPI00142C64D8|nr:arylsulfatase [Moorena sp. SIO4G3]NEO81078.1 arylsulfatase [Moorena sp. SIO4G3]
MFFNGFLNRILRGVVVFAIATSLLLTTIAPPAMAQQILPHPDPAFTGKIGLTYEDSKEVELKLKEPSSFGIENAPNILLVLLDDVGYGQMGTFGGRIKTPTLDRLAENGLKYTQFHTTGLCSPTRASLLTGRNHHSVGTGVTTGVATSFPGYSSVIPQNTATFADVLQAYGYATAWIGKNHNVPDWETSAVGPFDRWAQGLGFDYFYGFVGGDVDQYTPPLVENTTRLIPPEKNADGSDYYLNTDLADHAINYIQTTKALAEDKPFFVYFAPGATHAPHQVPQDWIDKYKGKFDMGWDKYRKKTIKRQKELGVIPPDAQLTPRPESLPKWDSLKGKKKRLYARMMEVFAAFTAQTDHEVGRVIDAIEDLGELDNTLIIYIAGDNGSSAEGGLQGVTNELTFFNGLEEDFQDKFAAIDELGGEMHYNHFPAAWAWAMDTPFQWTKQIASHFGGTRNGMVISWPDRITDVDDVRYQFSHVIDIAPTILEAIGIEAPTLFNGVMQKPIEGTSLAYTFDAKYTLDPTKDLDEQKKYNAGKIGAPSKHTTQYFEMLTNQGIYDKGWMASAKRGDPWLSENPEMDLLDMPWELYNIKKDFSQAVDLADQKPKKLEEMIKLFYAEASKYNVLPLDDRKSDRVDVANRPSLTKGRKVFTYPDHFRVPEGSAPDLKRQSHKITANVIWPEDEDGEGMLLEGMLLTLGGRFSGYGLFVEDGQLVYHYNWAGIERYEISAPLPPDLPTNTPITLQAVYKTVSDAKIDENIKDDDVKEALGKVLGAEVALYVNDQPLTITGSNLVCKSIPNRFTLDETLDVGFDTGTPIRESYKDKMPFDFTGTLKSVTIKLIDDVADPEVLEPCIDESFHLNPIPFYD